MKNSISNCIAWWAISDGATHYYGFGTRRQAEVYSDLLDSRDGREFNLFRVEEIGAEESEDLNTWRNDGSNLADEIAALRTEVQS